MNDAIRLDARGPATRLVILAHGVGGTASDLDPLGRRLRDGVEGLAVALPEGPEPFDQLPQGRQWFSIAGVTETNRPVRVHDALSAFRMRILAEARRLALQPDAVFVAGFSQGAIMAHALGVAGPERWGGVVALSGRLAEKPSGAVFPQRVLIRHGDADQVMPVAQARLSAQWLGEAGCDVALQIVPGLGHTLDGAAAAEITRFISAAHRPPSRG